MPQVDFLLAGRHSDELHRSNLPPNVHLLGTVSDDELELLLGAADMALNPIHTGGGSNLKLLTYLAAGLPVITSAVGARGIDAANAGVVVSGLERLGDAIERVAGASGEERARAGRAYVEANADWRMIGARFAELVHELVLA
jgi:glycosyltransferase involved in cell wall biosynthesis